MAIIIKSDRVAFLWSLIQFTAFFPHQNGLHIFPEVRAYSVPVQAGCTEGIFLTVGQFKKQIYVYLQEKTVSKKNIEQKKGVTIAP